MRMTINSTLGRICTKYGSFELVGGQTVFLV